MSFARPLPRLFLLICLGFSWQFALADAHSHGLVVENQFIESTPEAEGVPSSAIRKFVDRLEKNSPSAHSFVLLRHGKKIAEAWWAPYRKQEVHQIWSMSKSVTSAAIGFAVAEKRLGIYDPVIKFFPDDLPSQPSEHLKNLRVKDLLTMSTGQEQDPFEAMFMATDPGLARIFFAQPFDHKPGTLFVYNSGATYMLSAIIQKVTGQKLVDYLRPRLFEPLGIYQHPWEQSRDGITYGGFGLYLTTEDIAKFGQLYLNQGAWNGKQLLPAEWIAMSAAKQVSNGSNPEGFWDQGYGFQFWRNVGYGYRADGAFGQFCFILPEYDLVLAVTSGSQDMRITLDSVWQELIPQLQAGTLAAAPAENARLRKQLSRLALPVAEGKRSSSLVKLWSGKRIAFDSNELGISSAVIEFGSTATQIAFNRDDLSARLEAGYQHWVDSEFAFDEYFHPNVFAVVNNVASSAAWVHKNHFVVKMVCRHTHHTLTLNFRFSGDKVIVDGERDLDFGERKLPVLTGKRTP